MRKHCIYKQKINPGNYDQLFLGQAISGRSSSHPMKTIGPHFEKTSKSQTIKIRN